MVICMLLLMLAFTALFRMGSSVTLGEKPAEIQNGESGFTTLVPIAILMVLALVLGLFMPAQLTDLLNGAVEVVNAGVTATPLAGPGGSASLSGPIGGSAVELFFSFFSGQ
jgi:formate hydrogenlyase subunit 3/multisubunit Na+/H+ antiporter MnhD subunit